MLELAELATHALIDQLCPEEVERLEQWRVSQSGIATFFLDSVDELKLTQGSFRIAITQLRKTIDGRLGRARVVITSRPVPFERDLVHTILPIPPKPEPCLDADSFADIAMGMAKKGKPDDKPSPWRTVELLPLSDEQIKLFASGQGVCDPEAFLVDICRRNAVEFAERPQDLIELCAEWRDHHRTNSYQAQVASAVTTRLRPRTDRRERAELSPDRAYEGASRLALAAILMRRLTFRHGPESDAGGPPGTVIDPADILPDWTEDERRTLLERALFGFASYGRVRFHHRSVLEYLAGRRLARYLAGGKPIAAVKRLLFAETAQGEMVVRPAMRPVAAWLALERASIFADVLERDPTVMLNFGDPDAMSDGQKAMALSAYVKRHGRGGLRGLSVPHIQVRRLAAPGLAAVIQELWPTVENNEVRELLLDLVGAGRMNTCGDLAFEVANSPVEPVRVRLCALDALTEIADPRLQGMGHAIETDPEAWPREIARLAIVSLFPKHMSVKSLLKILARLTDKRSSPGYATFQLPHCIAQLDSKPILDTLVQGLSVLVGEGVVQTENCPPYRSCRQVLLPALAAACVRRMSIGPFVPNLAEAVALALRLAEDMDESDRQLKTLREQVAGLSASNRAMLFWIEDRARQSKYPEIDLRDRYWGLAHHGPIRLNAEQDAAWLHAALKDSTRPIPERTMMLNALLSHGWDSQDTWEEHTERVQGEVADSAELLAIADQLLKPLIPSPEHVALEASLKEQEAKVAAQRARDHDSWKRFWGELVSNPEAAFAPERAETTAWNLWRVFSQIDAEDRGSGWDRRFIEAQFGATVANRTRDALRSVWRQYSPTLWSEREPGKRNTYPSLWALGLAAIDAEAEDRVWATKLTTHEARLACRYAPIRLNGLPSWLDDLVLAYPVEVEEVLGGELAVQLRAPASVEGSGLLASIRYSSSTLRRLLRSALLSWIEESVDVARGEGTDAASVARVETVLEILLHEADDAIRQRIRQRALDRLANGIIGPAATAWLTALIKIDPDIGTATLEQSLSTFLPAKHGPAIDVFAAFLSDRHSGLSILAGGAEVSPQILLRLVTLAYQHIHIDDDDRHEGAYTPDARDDAQHARNVLLDALLRTKGPDGWAAKLALAAAPWFAHMRDRVLAIACEMAAEDADSLPATAAAMISLERHGEAPPATRNDMFQLMKDRLDDLDDLLLQDGSPRELWAGVKDERVIRRAISHELKVRANGAYNVDQESVTADEKETDIRLRSTVSAEEGVIEVKIGEKDRSAADLRQALSDQLVRKYMAPEMRRAGLLLITVANNRRWEHPDSGESIDLAGLIAMLNQHAHRIMGDLGGTLRVAARGLDLRPRITSERTTKAARKREGSGIRTRGIAAKIP